jgi:hypothetical protein
MPCYLAEWAGGCARAAARDLPGTPGESSERAEAGTDRGGEPMGQRAEEARTSDRGGELLGKQYTYIYIYIK